MRKKRNHLGPLNPIEKHEEKAADFFFFFFFFFKKKKKRPLSEQRCASHNPKRRIFEFAVEVLGP